MIAIVDYGLGNIKAFSNIYNRLGIPHKFARQESDFHDATHIILPGVGSFDFAMDKLNTSGMRERLDELVLDFELPVLGICVGMQIMASGSEEGNKEGLGWFNTEVCKFKSSNIHYPLPHMGWNSLNIHTNSILFSYLNDKKIFYFLHSYHFKSDYKHTIATSNYSTDIGAVIKKDNIFGIQCHPEKSHYNGVTLLKNFYEV